MESTTDAKLPASAPEPIEKTSTRLSSSSLLHHLFHIHYPVNIRHHLVASARGSHSWNLGLENVGRVANSRRSATKYHHSGSYFLIHLLLIHHHTNDDLLQLNNPNPTHREGRKLSSRITLSVWIPSHSSRNATQMATFH